MSTNWKLKHADYFESVFKYLDCNLKLEQFDVKQINELLKSFN